MVPSVVVVVPVVRAVTREARSGQGEDGEDRHDDFLVVVRFITSSLSPLVGLTSVEAAARIDSDRGLRKKSLSREMAVARASGVGQKPRNFYLVTPNSYQRPNLGGTGDRRAPQNARGRSRVQVRVRRDEVRGASF